MGKKKTSPAWPKELYQPVVHVLKDNFTDAEIRAEYSGLRDIAEKRLKRLAESEFKESQTYKSNVGRFPTLKELTPKGGVTSDLAKALTDVEKFVSAKTSNISGLKAERKQAIKTLHSHGYDFVNEKNYNAFVDYMEFVKTKALNKMYYSDAAVEAFGVAERKGINPEELKGDLTFWIKHLDELDAMTLPEGERNTAAAYRRAIKKNLGKK